MSFEVDVILMERIKLIVRDRCRDGHMNENIYSHIFSQELICQRLFVNDSYNLGRSIL